MRNLLWGSALLFSCNFLAAQVTQNNNTIEVKAAFKPNTHYYYDVVFTQSELIQQDTLLLDKIETTIDVYTFSEGEGFSMFEWKSPLIAFNHFTTEEQGPLVTVLKDKPFMISYRTDESAVMGEVSNFDEIAEVFGAYYTTKNAKTVEENYDLATNTGMYLTALFHQFYGLHFPVDKKTTMNFLFYNPMTNVFESSKNDINYLGYDKGLDLYGFEIEQKGLKTDEDNSVSMMNHKKASTFKNTKKGDNYSIEAFGERTFKGDGIPASVTQTTVLKLKNRALIYDVKMTARKS